MFARIHFLRLAAFALIAALAGAMLVESSSPASAQERVERKSFLQLLFGGGRSSKSDNARSSRVKKPSSDARAGPPPEPEIEKLENARKILVLGDFLAGGVADGLKEAFSQAPGVIVVDKSNGSSGLVRDDYYNWIAEAPAIVAETQPSIIAVLIGSNDRQQLVVNGEREAVRSVNWMTEYERRTGQLISILRSGKAPLLWIGLPAFKSSSMTTDVVALNGVYRKLVEKAGGEFVDIWDGFVDEEGKFVFTGSDINGQQVRLRGSDGINLTRAGRRKIAFYAEKPIRRLLGDAAADGVAAIDPSNFPEIFMPPPPGESPAAVLRTLPVAMTDPDLDGGAALLDEMPTAATLTRSPRDLLVVDGLPPEPPEDRADNFAWPKPGP